MDHIDLLLLFVIPVVSVVTFLFGNLKQLGVIRSSCFVGLISYLFFPAQATLLYGATFVGMCSREKFSVIEVVISSLFYYIIVYFLTQWFKGVGGTLGMSAFLGVLLWQIMKRAIRNLSKRLKLRI